MIFPSHFDPKKYLVLNPDLKFNAGTDIESFAKNHYKTHGYNEGRKYKYSKNHHRWDNINILVVIVSCHKHSHLWDNIKNRTNNKLVIIAEGKENYYDQNSKMLYLKCNDAYDGLPEKIIMMIDQVLNMPEFNHITHIIKIDDHDNYFTNENIKNLYNLNELHEYDYLGQKLNINYQNYMSNYHFGKVPSYSNWVNKLHDVSNCCYFDGGCSYILSRRAMKKINKIYNANNIHDVRNNEIFEDIMISRLLRQNNIYPFEINYGIHGDK